MKKIFTITCLLLLCGCTSIDKYATHEARQEVKQQLPEISENMSSICFVRQGRFTLGGARPDIYHNNVHIGEIENNSYFCREFEPGQHLFVLKAVLQDDTFTSINLQKNKRAYVEFSFDYKELYFKEVAEDYALVIIGLAMDKLKEYGPI